MNSIELKDVTVLGTLAHRLLRSSMRLESDIYVPDRVYQDASYDWPADWEGRVLLALVRQMEATHREPSYLREIIRGVIARFNEQGYMGKVLVKQYDEQQLSSHNWLLRAFLEYYRLSGDEEIRIISERMIRNLYLPLIGAYRAYPVEPAQRAKEGRPDGYLTGECINGWYVSTDIGCAYMCFDALGMAFSELDMPELKPLLQEMFEEFIKIDFVGLSMQTHATLSGIRGMIRFYEVVKEQKILDEAIRLYRLYLSEGTTSNYSNQNWFGRAWWTEPCAIVDSYMDAMELFRVTNDIEWFEVAQKIYLNAFSRAQRQNGGFGCDNCVGYDTPFVCTHGNNEDAYWCCSMRGGEGLAEVARSIAMEKEGILHIGFYNPCEIRFSGGSLEMTTEYPEVGHVTIMTKGCVPNDKLALYVPSYAQSCLVQVNEKTMRLEAQNGFVTVEIPPNSRIEMNFDIPNEVVFEKMINNEEYYKVMHGFSMLGICSNDIISLESKKVEFEGMNTYRIGSLLLQPMDKTYCLSKEELMSNSYQLLFPLKESVEV